MKTVLHIGVLCIAFNAKTQIVSIPDTQFKAYLVGNTAINTNMDTEIQVSEATTFSGTIDCNGQNISDLTGIEYFTSLTGLFCYSNSLNVLDLTNNLALTDLNCSLNSLVSLDLSSHTLLSQLTCSYNDLVSLNVDNCPNLLYINCRDNLLSALNLSDNSNLMNLTCRNNQLTMLDASFNISLQVIICDNNNLDFLDVSNGNNAAMSGFNFNATNNPNLECIQVDDPNYSNTNWLDIDSQSFFSADCSSLGINELNIPNKKIVRIVDLLDRTSEFRPNTVLIYIYDNGQTERIFSLE